MTSTTTPTTTKITDDLSEIEIDLPWPPSLNRLWRFGNGRMWRSKAYVKWIKSADSLWMCLKPKGLRYPRIKGRFKAKILLAAPDERRRDTDNYVKAAFDWLQHAGIIEDDCLCDSHYVCWESHKNAPYGLRIQIKRLDNQK